MTMVPAMRVDTSVLPCSTASVHDWRAAGAEAERPWRWREAERSRASLSSVRRTSTLRTARKKVDR